MIMSYGCLALRPAIGCGAPEMFVLTMLYTFESIACVFFLVRHVMMRRRLAETGFDFHLTFWISITMWCIWHDITSTFDIPWNPTSVELGYMLLDFTLYFISFLLLSLINSELLFSYWHPKYYVVYVCRIVYVLHFIAFITCGGISVYADLSRVFSGSVMSALWRVVWNFVLAVLITVPTIPLSRAVGYPMPAPEDQVCLRWIRVVFGCMVFFLLFIALWRLLEVLNVNPLVIALRKMTASAPDPADLPIGARLLWVLFDLITKFFSSSSAIITVVMLRMHDVRFKDDPMYALMSDPSHR
jgi:hypothetical protein